MRRLLLFGALAVGVWAWLHRSRPERERPQLAPSAPMPPPAEPASANDADPTVREVESRLDDETKYERADEDDAEARSRAAERLRADPFTERLDVPPDEAA